MLLTNIKQLVNTGSGDRPLYGKEMAELPVIENAWLLIEGNEIAGFGKMDSLIKTSQQSPNRTNGLCWEACFTCLVRQPFPSCFCRAAGKMNLSIKSAGFSYAEINARGGGILNTVQKINDISEDELFRIFLEKAGGSIQTGHRSH